MRDVSRWWLAGLVTVLVFAAVTWIFADLLAPLWVSHDEGACLAWGLGAGTAAAALAALWGQGYATAPVARHEHPEAERGTRRRLTAHGGQGVAGSAVGGGVTQVAGAGEVRITRRGVPSAAGTSPAERSAAAEPASGGQHVSSSEVAGPVDQIRDVDGTVEIEQ
ncbi:MULTISPECIES: hypothetical protein [unclassified Streptomyces]|jgi:hypothetical protein|uniref:hypothetical protein n=1 Tax=unclassified Streptomyces TaxID=2593676 RepID=UPI002E25AA0D